MTLNEASLCTEWIDVVKMFVARRDIEDEELEKLLSQSSPSYDRVYECVERLASERVVPQKSALVEYCPPVTVRSADVRSNASHLLWLRRMSHQQCSHAGDTRLPASAY